MRRCHSFNSFLAERQLHQANCECVNCVVIKCLSTFIQFDIHFSYCHFFSSLISPPTLAHMLKHTHTHTQSPSGGTSGLCLKKLNITTSSYRIIINRLDRKVNPSLILPGDFASTLRQTKPSPFHCLSSGDGELQTCATSLFPSLSFRGRHGQHVPDPDTRRGQHTVVSQHRHHGAAVHYHL